MSELINKFNNYTNEPIPFCDRHGVHMEYCHDNLDSGVKITVRECQKKGLCDNCIEETKY